MGNYFVKCCIGVSVIRVMRPDGRIDKFEYPVTAAVVMRRYPEHLVIQSNYNSPYENASRRLSIVRPETTLLPSRLYLLYRIPEQFREIVAQSVADQTEDSPSDFEREEIDGSQQQELQQFSRRKTSTWTQFLGAIRHHLEKILISPREFKVGDEEWDVDSLPGASRMNLRGRMDVDEKRSNVAENEEEEAFSFCQSASWKPSLCSIPESPPSSPFSPAIACRTEECRCRRRLQRGERLYDG